MGIIGVEVEVSKVTDWIQFPFLRWITKGFPGEHALFKDFPPTTPAGSKQGKEKGTQAS